MKRALALMLPLLFVGPAGPWALPQGGVVQEGSASWSQGADSLLVNQASDRALIDWTRFDIANGETVRFVQPGANSVAINRVVGDSLLPSQIDGNLFANGNVWILNPNGVLAGANARFDVGGLALGAAQMGADGSWLTTGKVENHGEIVAGSGGVVLGGREVANHGHIATQGGNVTLAAGTKMQVGLLGGLVTVEAEPSAVPLRIENTGQIVAPGGQVGLMMQAVDAGVGGAMNVGGRLVANTVGEQGGVIRLGYAPDVKITGELRAEGTQAGEKGGRVEVVGGFVDLASGARLSADGAAGGGEVLVGGDYRGAALQGATAQNVTVAQGAELRARATEDGDGGKVVVWGDNLTRFAGHVAADGAGRGDGGLMEVSGKKQLVFRGTASARGGGEGGAKGRLLLDPEDIIIADGSGGTDDAEVGDGTIGGGENPGGVYTISEQSLEALAAGTDVYLEATRHITIQDLSDNVLNLAATGNVTMIADSDLDGTGDFTMNAGDSIVTAADLTLRGANVTLGSLNTSSGNGNITLETTNSAGAVTLGGSLNAGTGGLTLAGNLQRLAGLNLTNVGALTLSGNSTLTGGNIVMDAANTIGGAHTLAVNGNNVTLAGVNGVTGLAVNGTGAVTFLGNVNAGGAVNVTGAGGITGAAGPWTVDSNGGALSFNNALTLAGNTTLDSGGGLLTVGAVDGPHALVLDSGAGNTLATGVLGGATALASFAHSGNMLDMQGVRTSGAQTYNAATTARGMLRSTGGNIAFNNNVLLGGNTSVQVAGANNVTFAGTVDGGNDLAVMLGSGMLTFNGAVGSGAALGNLTTSGHVDIMADVMAGGNVLMTGGPVHIQGDVTSGGDLTLGTNVDLWGDVVLTGGGANGDVITLGPVTGAHALTLAAGSGQVVLNGFDVAAVNLAGADGVTLNGGNYLSGGAMDWSAMGALGLGGNVLMQAGNGPGYAALTLGSGNTLNGNGHDLTLRGSTVTLDSVGGVDVLAVEGSALAVNGNVSTDGTQTFTGPVALGGNLTSSNDTITLNGDVTLVGDRRIETGAGAGNIVLGGDVDGAQALVLDAGAGNVSLAGNVGSAVPLTSLDVTAAQASLNGVRTTGDVDVQGNMVLGGQVDAGGSLRVDGTLLANSGAGLRSGDDLTVTGPVTLADDLTVTSGGGAGDVMTLGDGASGDHLLTLDAGAGNIVLTGNLDVDALTLVNGNDLIYGGGTILTDQAMNFSNLNRLLLGGDTVMAAGEGGVAADITFGAGNQILATAPGVDLTMTGDLITLHQIGDTGAGALETLTVNADTVVMLGNIYTLGNQTINANEGLAGVLFSAGGDIVLNTRATLVGDVTVQSHGGNVYFNNTLNGNHNLLVEAGTGNVYLNAVLGGYDPLASVMMSGADLHLTRGVRTVGNQVYEGNRIFLNAGLATQAGSFRYRAPIVLTGNSALVTGGGDIVFENTVNGSHALELRAGGGDIIAQQAMGGSTKLGAVNVRDATNVSWNNGIFADSYHQRNVAGLTDVRGVGIRSGGNVDLATSGRVLGHVSGERVFVEASGGWIGTVEAHDKLVLSNSFTQLEGTVRGMGGRSAALATEFGHFYGGPHYLNGYGLPLHELSMPRMKAHAARCMPWYDAYGSQAPTALGLPDDGLWGSCLDWTDTWDTVGDELWADERDAMLAPAAGG